MRLTRFPLASFEPSTDHRNMHHVVIILDDFPPIDVIYDEFLRSGRDLAPNMRRLMLDREDGGTYFPHCDSTVSKCKPSRAGFMWAKWPTGTGVWNNRDRDSFTKKPGSRRPKNEMFTRLFKANPGGGLNPREVHSFGKILHYADRDDYGHNSHVWDYGEDQTDGRAQFYDQEDPWAQVPGVPPSEYEIGHLTGPTQLTDDQITEDVIEFIDKHYGETGKSYMLVAGFKAGHENVVTKHEVTSATYPAIADNGETDYAFLGDYSIGLTDYIRGQFKEISVGDSTMARVLNHYLAMIADTDSRLGQIVNALKNKGSGTDNAWKRTVLTVVSDHSFIHGMFDDTDDNRTPYKKELVFGLPARSLAFIRRPNENGTDPVDIEYHGAVGLPDITRTLIEIAGIAAPANMEGRDLTSALTGGSSVNGTMTYTRINNGPNKGEKQRAFVKRLTFGDQPGVYRYIKWGNGAEMLFREYDSMGVPVDPLNRNELSGSPDHSAYLATMRSDMAAERVRLGDQG